MRALSNTPVSSALVALILGGCLCASASTPDWLRAAAQTTLPKYPEDTAAVQLVDEQITTVSDNGEIKTLYRRAFKILNTKGRKYGKAVVSFDKETRLTYLKGWCIPAQGKDYEVKEKDAIEIGLSAESLYDDTKYKVLDIPAAEPGNVVGYEFEQRRRPTIYQDAWWFQEEVPVKSARFTLHLPKDWEYKSFWVNRPPQEPQSPDVTQATWEEKDVPPIEAEPSMPDWRAVASRMVVTYFPPKAEMGGKSLASWQDVSAWYAHLAEGRRNVTPEIRQKVQELTSGAGTTLDKVKALASFVQKDIRYVAIEIGIGGYQPHAAGEIFTDRYGDCKDKATLLSAMLGEIGIKSDYVLLNVNRGVVAPDLPTLLGFNHVILAIQLPQDDSWKSLHAVSEDPRLGRVLFFDPTDPMTPLGDLPPYEQSNYGLLVSGDSGELVKMPLIPPALNRLLRAAKLVLTPTGGIYGSVDELRWGYPARELRARLLSQPEAERSKMLESFLANFMGGFALESSQVENLDRPDDTLIVHYRFEARDYAKSAGDLLLVRPRVMGTKDDDVMEVTKGSVPQERKYPVEFSAATLQSDVFDIQLPPGYKVDELPPPVTVDMGSAIYKSKVEINGGTLHYTRMYQINDVLIPLDHLGELKKFYRQIAADERNSAVLKQVTQ